MRTLRLAIAVLLSTVALTLAPACGTDADNGTKPAGAQSLPPLTIRDDTPNLMLTWMDDKGDTKVVLKPAEVPDRGKSPVRVIVTDKTDGTGDLFYVVDLSKKTGDGYVARTMPRSEWEAELEKRRAAYLAKNAPPPPVVLAPTGAAPSTTTRSDAPPPVVPTLGITVIIYGAEWCKPCHMAAAFFKSKGAAVIDKDVEADPEAAREMRDKLEKSGQRGGSIPVIDVRGEILVGFDQRSAERALAKAAGGTAL